MDAQQREKELGGPEAATLIDSAPTPQIVDRQGWQQQLDELLLREKAHTREGDAIAAARRRLPMVEVDPATPVTGSSGLVPLRDVFDDRRQLVVYYHMWHDGQPSEGQCEGCTFFNGMVGDLSYLHSRDVTYATFCEGDYDESVRYHDAMGWSMPWYSARPSTDVLLAGRWFGMLVSYLQVDDRVFETYWTTGRATEAMSPSYGLLDMTVYGRQEPFEDSPVGWPQRFANDGSQFRIGGRPTAQWERVEQLQRDFG